MRTNSTHNKIPYIHLYINDLQTALNRIKFNKIEIISG